MHRDVKPANVLIARQRGTEAGTHGYLTDFGLTKRSASDSGVTGTGQFVGTLDYAAPEQFRGEDVDPRTDVYSLGCLFFECLAGHPPFRAENDAALMFAHLMEAPPPLTAERPDLPKDIDDVVATAMAKEPEARYPSAGAFAIRASAALGHPIDEPSAGRLAAGARRLGRDRAADGASRSGRSQRSGSWSLLQLSSRSWGEDRHRRASGRDRDRRPEDRRTAGVDPDVEDQSTRRGHLRRGELLGPQPRTQLVRRDRPTKTARSSKQIPAPFRRRRELHGRRRHALGHR